MIKFLLFTVAAALTCQTSFSAETSPPSVTVIQELAARPLLLWQGDRIPELVTPPRITAQEFEHIRQEQRRRTYQDAITIARENTAACIEVLSAAGIDMTKKPHTGNLMMLVLHDTTTLGTRELLRWQTPSPSEFGRGIVAITPALCPYSYPAVHALNLRMAVNVLEACVEKELPEARGYAAAVKSRRIRGGMDWPSAISAAEQLADYYLAAFSRQAPFQNRLRLARNEW